MSLILHMFFCCCNVHIVFVYCKKKSCQYFMNNAWALPMFNLFFFSIFISKSYYETLLYFPHAFYIIFLLKKIPLDLLHTMLLQACWYKNTVSSSLQCTCTCMNVSMLDSQCNIYTSLGSLECSNSSLEVHKVFSLKTMMQ